MCTASAFMETPATGFLHGHQHVTNLPPSLRSFVPCCPRNLEDTTGKAFPWLFSPICCSWTGVTWREPFLGNAGPTGGTGSLTQTIFSHFPVLLYPYIENVFPNTQSKSPLLPFKLDISYCLSNGFWWTGCPLKPPFTHLNAGVIYLTTLF